MYDKPDDRSGIDVREDPFEMSFKLLFNDPAFKPEAPDSAFGMTQSALDEMAVAAADRPHERKSEVLKNRWRSIRTGFTNVWRKNSPLPMCGARIRSPDNKIQTHFQTFFFLMQPLKSLEPRCTAQHLSMCSLRSIK
jgi:hypothetical protein